MPFEFDELNVFSEKPKKRSKNRSVPYKKYFGEMYLTNEEVEERIRLAEKLEGAFSHLFSFVELSEETGNTHDVSFLTMLAIGWILDAIADFGIEVQAESYMQMYAEELAQQVVDATLRNIEDSYYTSEDRAKFIAENEANAIQNRSEYERAVADKRTSKTWHSMEDRAVRPTHAEVNGRTVPIDEPFHVGNSLLMYPKDVSLDADAEEIVNCRCSVSYR